MRQTILHFHFNLGPLQLPGRPLETHCERLRIVVDHGGDRGSGRFTPEWLTTDAAGGDCWVDPKLVTQIDTEGLVRFSLACALRYLLEGSPHLDTTFGGGVFTRRFVLDELDERFTPIWVPVQRQDRA